MKSFAAKAVEAYKEQMEYNKLKKRELKQIHKEKGWPQEVYASSDDNSVQAELKQEKIYCQSQVKENDRIVASYDQLYHDLKAAKKEINVGKTLMSQLRV